jgi:prepilin-type N-terminal cleavage/methylation domain-containing protein
MTPYSLQRGVTLIELLLAVLISAIVMAAINGLVKLGMEAQTGGREFKELVYQGRFALDRMTDRARAVPPKLLNPSAATTTGDWFAPAGCSGTGCAMYCLNGSNQLIETIVSDTTCSGTTVIANRVAAFAATLPASAGAVDRSLAVISLTMQDTSRTLSLSSSIRLGGGTQ